MYSSERNVQILISLLKAHGVKKMVLSPGSANASFVGSVQFDKDFQLYSCIDERSAAYMACGLSEESGEPVVICCTGATASRNYMPALTEAFYRKIPIIAITATRNIALLGHNRDQLIDRTVTPKDIVVKSVHLPVVATKDDEWECNVKINDALLEMHRNGGGPVHINLTTSYSTDFSVKEIPKERVIERVTDINAAPELPNGNIGIFVGAHSRWDERLTSAVDNFCKCNNAVVFYDQTSNYAGEFGVPCGLFGICGFPPLGIDLIIHLGNISAAWPTSGKATWRVNPDGEIRDTYRSLENIFQMSEAEFFEHYIDRKKSVKASLFDKVKESYKKAFLQLLDKEEQIPFSSLWMAQKMHKKIPSGSVMHFGILNSLRCWNCYELDSTIRGYSNTGGFGIDGGVSSLIGASLVNPDKLYFGIFGDLAFFYDMNSIGNRHIGSNVRIMVVNNGLGGEFKNILGNVQKAGFGDKANDYISAYGHYGTKSPNLLKHFSEDLGFKYLSADSKSSFESVFEEFLSEDDCGMPVFFEVFVDDHDDADAIKYLKTNIKFNFGEEFAKSGKRFVKSILGESGVKALKKIIK